MAVSKGEAVLHEHVINNGDTVSLTLDVIQADETRLYFFLLGQTEARRAAVRWAVVESPPGGC